MVLLLVLFPLFRLVPLSTTREQADDASFNAVRFMETFWSGPLMAATEDAVSVVVVREALLADPVAAAAEYGHRLGLSGSAAYLVRGEGRVVEVTEDGVAIALDESGNVAIRIEIGPVFGNAIRDGSGLFDVSAFANTRDFNDLSAEINRRVEEQVLPELKAGAAAGSTIRFSGGIEVADGQDLSVPLVLVPVQVAFP